MAWKHPKLAGLCLHKQSITGQSQIRLADGKIEPQAVLYSTQSENSTNTKGSNNGVTSPGEGEGWNSPHSSQRLVNSLAVAADTLIPLSVTSKYTPGSSTNLGQLLQLTRKDYFRSSPEPQLNFLTLKYQIFFFPVVHLFPVTHPQGWQGRAARLELALPLVLTSA